MATLFISDLHLSTEQESLAQLFYTFLDTVGRAADALYILGDFFEVWLGDDNQNAHDQKVIQALHDYTRSGIPTYFMPGNRDFLIGREFIRQTGCILLPDPMVIDLYGVPTLLMHGDSLCTRDIKHQWFRKWSRSAFVRRLYLSLSAATRTKVANKIRTSSKKRGANLAADIQDVTPELIPKIFQQYQVEQMIHGHTHRPAIDYFKLNDGYANRIVLSDWGPQGNCLVCHPDGSKQLIYF